MRRTAIFFLLASSLCVSLLLSCDALLAWAVEGAGGTVQTGSIEAPIILRPGLAIDGARIKNGKVDLDRFGNGSWHAVLRIAERGDYRLEIEGEYWGSPEIEWLGEYIDGRDLVFSQVDNDFRWQRWQFNNLAPGDYRLRWQVDSYWSIASLRFSSVVPANEGSPYNPVQLVLGQSRTGKVGGGENSFREQTSYYGFYVASDQMLDILAVPEGDFALGLSVWGPSGAPSLGNGTHVSTGIFTAGEYKIAVGNTAGFSGTFTICARAHESLKEGNVEAPVPLSIGERRVLTVGSGYESSSYYMFHVEAAGVFDLALVCIDYYDSLSLYSDAAFSDLFAAFDYWSQPFSVSLSPGDWFLMLSGSTAAYSLAIEAVQ